MEALKCPACSSTELVRMSAGEYRCASCRTVARLDSPAGVACPSCGWLNPVGTGTCAKCAQPLGGYSLVLRPGIRGYDLKCAVRLLKTLYPELGLKPAKCLCEKESVIAAGLPLEQALTLKEQFARCGALVEVREADTPVDPVLRGLQLCMQES